MTEQLLVTFDRPAYTVAEWAKAVGYGETTIRKHIEDGNLVPSWATPTKKVITLEEGLRWLRTLPNEQPLTEGL